MIRRIIMLNLKDKNDKKNIFILIIIGILITSLQFRLINSDSYETLLMSDIIIETYGGLSTEFNVLKDIFLFILWITPNILVIYLINISVVDRFRESITLVSPRAISKKKWYIAFNLSVIIKISEYFLVLILSSLIVIWVKLGCAAFTNTTLCEESIININININQYKVLLYIVLLNILTLVAVQFFLDNLYNIFFNSNEASAIGIIFFVAPVFYTKSNIVCNLLLTNDGMMKRHEIFKNGLEGLNIVNSLVIIITFIIINFFIGIFIIKRRDLININY